MSAVISEWHFRLPMDEWSPVRVPLTRGRLCNADHPEGWVCSRLVGHSGRHAATIGGCGEVVAVWR